MSERPSRFYVRPPHRPEHGQWAPFYHGRRRLRSNFCIRCHRPSSFPENRRNDSPNCVARRHSPTGDLAARYCRWALEVAGGGRKKRDRPGGAGTRAADCCDGDRKIVFFHSSSNGANITITPHDVNPPKEAFFSLASAPPVTSGAICAAKHSQHPSNEPNTPS